MTYKIKRNRKRGGSIDPLYIPKKMYQIMTNELTKNDPKSRPLYLGELHPTSFSNGSFHHSNFLGPGTKINLNNVYDFPPQNPADAAAKIHDIAYKKIGDMYKNKQITEKQREKLIRQSDEVLINQLKQLPNMDFRDAGLKGMASKVKVEDLFPTLTRKIAGPSYFGSKN